MQRKENFSNKCMVVGSFCGRGVLPLIKVPEKLKINGRYYIDFVLKPQSHLKPLGNPDSKLYGSETSKVVVHHDAASSHTEKLTQEYAKD